MVKPWMEFRQEITRLYIQEALTLTDVQKIMREHHGFQASVRSYRQHFDQWNLQKYNCKKRHTRRRRQLMMKGTLPSPPYTHHDLAHAHAEMRASSAADELPLLLSHNGGSGGGGGGNQGTSGVRSFEYAEYTPPSVFTDHHAHHESRGYPPSRRALPSDASHYGQRQLPQLMHRDLATSPNDIWYNPPYGSSMSTDSSFSTLDRLPPMDIGNSPY